MTKKTRQPSYVWNYETKWQGAEQPFYERVGEETDWNKVDVRFDYGKPDHSFYRKHRQRPDRKAPEGY